MLLPPDNYEYFWGEGCKSALSTTVSFKEQLLHNRLHQWENCSIKHLMVYPFGRRVKVHHYFRFDQFEKLHGDPPTNIELIFQETVIKL